MCYPLSLKISKYLNEVARDCSQLLFWESSRGAIHDTSVRTPSVDHLNYVLLIRLEDEIVLPSFRLILSNRKFKCESVDEFKSRTTTLKFRADSLLAFIKVLIVYHLQNEVALHLGRIERIEMKLISLAEQVDILHAEVVEWVKLIVIEQLREITLNLYEVFGPIPLSSICHPVINVPLGFFPTHHHHIGTLAHLKRLWLLSQLYRFDDRQLSPRALFYFLLLSVRVIWVVV